MAESLAHRWGQIIGDVFEGFVYSVLSSVAERHELFLDRPGPRKARPTRKVTWRDSLGNKHDFDYVIERGGSEERLGVPVAFIESAWRRYTKHSKNKVQEIEAAVEPVARTFDRHKPFRGAVLAGEFTRNAVQQLESNGFAVLHIPYASILEAFAALEIDASSVDGKAGTTEEDFREKITQWEKLPQPQAKVSFLAQLNSLHSCEIARFQERLEATLNRRVVSIRLTVLRGNSVECLDVPEAISYLIDEERSFRLREGDEREAFEIQVRFNTGAEVKVTCAERDEALAFLRSFA